MLRRLSFNSSLMVWNSDGSVKSYFSPNTIPEYDRTVYLYLRLIIIRHLSVTIVDDKDNRQFARNSVPIVYKNMISVIPKFLKMVVERIVSELKSTVGAILFEGWSSNSTHFVCI